MVFEDNGNLRLYQNDDSVVWSTESQWRHAETFGLADDGKLVFYNKEGNSVWDSDEKVTFNSGNKITSIKLELYYLALNIVWCFKPKSNHRSKSNFVRHISSKVDVKQKHNFTD